MASNRKKPGDWARLSDGWYRVTMGTDYWLPKPPSDVEVVYIAKNLFYKPNGCSDLNRNNIDCWSMLITSGPQELMGQEIVWFNRKPDDATDVPLEVAEDMVDHYSAMGAMPDEALLSIFDINPALGEHPSFNEGVGILDIADPRLKQHMMQNAANLSGGALEQDLAQLQEFYDNQGWGGHYDNAGVVTSGGRHGGPEIRSQEDMNYHFGNEVQLPGGSGRQSTQGMQAANPSNDEYFGANGRSAPRKWNKLLAGIMAAGGALFLLASRGHDNG